MDEVAKVAAFPESVKASFAPRRYSPARLPTRDEFGRVMGWLKGKGTIKGAYFYEDLVDDRGLRAK